MAAAMCSAVDPAASAGMNGGPLKLGVSSGVSSWAPWLTSSATVGTGGAQRGPCGGGTTGIAGVKARLAFS